MTLGTKTLLFGVHQIFIHPLLVLIAWVKIYKSVPSPKELFCIFIHDWGYWGKPNLKNADGDIHPELGARIAHWLFDKSLNASPWIMDTEWQDFILGHSSFYMKRNGVKQSKLFAADKYWHCMIPLWFYKILAVPTGEFKHYRELKHARQVSELHATDTEWWLRLQSVCKDKVAGDFKIDGSKLSK